MAQQRKLAFQQCLLNLLIASDRAAVKHYRPWLRLWTLPIHAELLLGHARLLIA